MSRVFAYKNIKSEVFRSSSGGAFIALCNAFEDFHGKGNVVFYGAVLANDMSVRHQRSDSAEACHVFQGSKYVRSGLMGVFSDLANDLKSNKYALFSGTPCEVFGVKLYLKKNEISDEKLLTIDIICHGVSKMKIWDDYKIWLEKINCSKLVAYSFRYKPEGWKAYPAYAKFENGKELRNTALTSVFSTLYMKSYSIVKGCFSCPFACEERQGDITLGDFWGIERIIPEVCLKEGVSLVLCNTKRSIQLLQYVSQEHGELLMETVDNGYLKFQHNLNYPTIKPQRYDTFWEFYETHSFEEVLKKYVGYGKKYELIYSIKKTVRKTPLIEWYRNKRSRRDNYSM